MSVSKNNLDQAIAAAREALVVSRSVRTDTEAASLLDAALTDLLAALDAARGEAVAYVGDAGRVTEADFAAQPAAPRVERYGDGVLVHWPEGMEQYVCVGDCVTGNLGAMAVPADTQGDEFGRGWNACRAAMLAQQPAAAVPADFTEWLAREMPAGTVIGDPQWWANLIARRFAQFAAKENTNG